MGTVPSGPHEALHRDVVGDVWDADPALALLRSVNGRWILPLFSEHLERAEGPVSADWFHQAVAEALARNAAEQAARPAPLATPSPDGEQQQQQDPHASTPGTTPTAPIAPSTPMSPADHCRRWVESRWLIRTRASGPEGRAHYRLSPHALRALRIVRELAESDSAVSEARLGSIAHAVRQLASLADPDAASQVARLDEQIAELTRRRDAIAAHGPEPVAGDALARQVREVVRLTASLPEDFRQLGAMVEQRHREVARRATHDDVGKGALVDQYLRENDLLEQTPEGRAYRGFAQMLAGREVDAMRADIEAILTHPDAAEHLGDGQRAQLEQLISSLLAEEQQVQETYARWTASLRRFLSRSTADRHQRLLTLAERALHAGGTWVDRQPGHAWLPEDVLVLGPLDAVDVSQVQLWSERGRPTVEVAVSEGAVALPDADRAALRLTAGTSTAAVAATVERLLDEAAAAAGVAAAADSEADPGSDEARRDGTVAVTSVDVYRATDPEFRRLGLVLSMLDLAIDRGLVADDTESVALTGDDGTVRRVTLPRLVFTLDATTTLQEDPA